jgi:hypothetical protein
LSGLRDLGSNFIVDRPILALSRGRRWGSWTWQARWSGSKIIPTSTSGPPHLQMLGKTTVLQNAASPVTNDAASRAHLAVKTRCLERQLDKSCGQVQGSRLLLKQKITV